MVQLSETTYETPLRWPDGRQRATVRRRAPFRVSLAVARDALLGELNRFGARQIVLSSNARLARNGQMTAVQPWTPDPGVAVWFTRESRDLCVACDAWDTIAANLRGIGKTVEAMRGIERWGADQVLDAALGGFAALPASTADDAPWTVLGVHPDATRPAIDLAYRMAAQRCHPDHGGDAAQFRRVTAAYHQLIGAVR